MCYNIFTLQYSRKGVIHLKKCSTLRFSILKNFIFIYIIFCVLFNALQYSFGDTVTYKNKTSHIKDISLTEGECSNLEISQEEIEAILNSSQIHSLIGKLECEKIQYLTGQSKHLTYTLETVQEELQQSFPYLKNNEVLYNFILEKSGITTYLHSFQNTDFIKNTYTIWLKTSLSNQQVEEIRTTFIVVFSPFLQIFYWILLTIFTTLLFQIKKQNCIMSVSIGKTYFTAALIMFTIFLHLRLNSINTRIQLVSLHSLILCIILLALGILLSLIERKTTLAKIKNQ